MKTLSTVMLIVGTGLLIASAYNTPGIIVSVLLMCSSVVFHFKLEPKRR